MLMPQLNKLVFFFHIPLLFVFATVILALELHNIQSLTLLRLLRLTGCCRSVRRRITNIKQV